MNQSPLQNAATGVLHVAIIMDGNGRWAELRGKPRVEGHRAGAAAVRRTIEAAPGLGIGTLTLYAFSTENWKRPSYEVSALMRLFEQHLTSETAECVGKGIRIRVVGRRDRLSPSLVAAIAEAENATAGGNKLQLRLAVDYSAQDAILRAAARLRQAPQLNREDLRRAIAEAIHDSPGTPDIDLLVRTGGELRLSDLFGWDSGYAELVFSKTMWPDFGAEELRSAVEEFRGRERRFGALPPVNLSETRAGRLNGV